VRKRIKFKPGDIFTFPIDVDRVGVGQVLSVKPQLHISVLREPASPGFDLNEVSTDQILLCGRTMDALFYHGRWQVVGHLPIPDGVIPRPFSHVRVSGSNWVQDFDGRLIRPATARETECLDEHWNRSPIGFENAFKAFHGLAAIDPGYEKLSIVYQRQQAAVC
jgi:hypothetical protein